MAVAFDAVGPSSAGASQPTGSTTLSWTHTAVASGVTILAGLSYDATSDAGVTATCKCDGVLMTSVAGPIHSGGGTGGFAQVWRITGIGSGAHTILVTTSSACDPDMEGGSVSFTGASSVGTAVTATGTSTTSSAAVTGTASSSLVFGFTAAGDSINATTAPATSRFVDNLEAASGHSTGNCAGSTSAGGGSVTMAWTVASSAPWAAIAVEVQAGGGGPLRQRPLVRGRLRRFRQQILPPSIAQATASGPPVYPLGHPVRAQAATGRGGTVSRRTGVYDGTGPPVQAWHGPVQARRQPQRGGSTAARTGPYDGLGPPVRMWDGPVRAQPAPGRGGRVASRAGTYTAVAGGSGPPVRMWDGPVQAPRFPQRPGTTTSRHGTWTFVAAGGAGPPVYPLGHPVQARRQIPRGGAVAHRAGPYMGSGPPVPPLKQPIGVYRRQLPPPQRGRVLSLHGPYQGLGPPVIPLRRPVRGQPQRPVLTGRVRSRAGVGVFVPPPPFSVGTLTATDTALASLTATGASGSLAATTAPSGALTAVTASAGADAAYEALYRAIYGAPGGTLTATDTRTGGPG